jgi:hypothetical protein
MEEPRYISPCHEGPLTEHMIMDGPHPVSPAAEEIVDRTIRRKNSLSLPRRLEATKATLSLSRGLMRDFNSIVQPMTLAVFNVGKSSRRAAP